MNRSNAWWRFGLFLSCATVLGACASTASLDAPEAPRPPDPPPVFPDRSPAEPAPIEAGVAAQRTPYAAGIDVHHYDIEIGLSDTQDRIWARAAIDVTLDEAAGGTLALDLTGLAVWSVRLDGHESPYQYGLGRLEIEAGEGRHRVEIRYVGTPDDGLIIRDNVHGDASVFADNWPNRARFWFPSVDDPSDKATVRFVVHAPTQWEVIANGAMLADPYRTSPNALTALGYVGPIGHRSWTWGTRVEIPAHTMVIGATNFAIHRIGQAACGKAPAAPNRCIDVTAWVFPQDSATAAQQFRRSAEMVDYFTQTIGPYPYEKLANVQSATRFGGMENSSAIFYSEQAIAQGRDIEGTVSHEIAHQWFGDGVSQAKWSHLWLSEGFATYYGALFFEHADGVENFRDRMRASRDRVLASDVVRRTPVIDENEANLFALLNDNNYPKGGWVLHMLRRRIGDEAFFGGVVDYYRKHKHQSVLTEDFREAMETRSGEDLTAFFSQWLENPGFPVVDVSWRWSAERGGVEVTVSQTQAQAWPTFSAPLDIEFQVGDERVRHTIEMSSRTTESFVALSAQPSGVLVDPDAWLLVEVHENAGGA